MNVNQLLISSLFTTTWLSASLAQDFDGLISHHDLLGKPAVVRMIKGPPIEGAVKDFIPSRPGQNDLQFIEITAAGNKTRRVKANTIASLQIDGRQLSLQLHIPSGRLCLVDQELATRAADARLGQMQKQRKPSFSSAEFEQRTEASRTVASRAIELLGKESGLQTEEGESVIVITDYPAAQRRQLLRALDQFIPKLNALFGFAAEEYVLPGKAIVGAFLNRANLGKFQSDFVGNPNYGDVRAFFFLVDDQVVVSAEDSNGPKQMLWQAAWGMAGAYSHFCYSDVTLPAWFRIGLQQHCADVLVPGVYDNPADQRLAVAEIKSGTLNGSLDADNIIGDRQLICKFIAAHVYKLSPVGFGQMHSMLKLGKTTNEALKSVFDMDQATFVRSFGKSVGLPQLTP